MSLDVLLAKDPDTGFFDFVIENGDAVLIDSTEGRVLAQVGSDRRMENNIEMNVGERRGFAHEGLFPSLVYGSLAWTAITQGKVEDFNEVTGYTREAVGQVLDLKDIKLQTGLKDDSITVYVDGRKVI